jgi:hypothetical protein
MTMVTPFEPVAGGMTPAMRDKGKLARLLREQEV